MPGGDERLMKPPTVIKILRESTSPAFHLIAPMEPGYGWSDPPPLDRGFNMKDCTALMNDLMVGLGFGDGYAAQVREPRPLFLFFFFFFNFFPSGLSWISPHMPMTGYRTTRENSRISGGTVNGKFVSQGGDIGSGLARLLAVNYEACKCININ